MSDVRIICKKCGRPFIWSYGEQVYFADHGLKQPKHCPMCRPARRAEFSQQNQTAQASRPVLPQARGWRSIATYVLVAVIVLAFFFALVAVWQLVF
jgi:hypothetical protein